MVVISIVALVLGAMASATGVIIAFRASLKAGKERAIRESKLTDKVNELCDKAGIRRLNQLCQFRRMPR